MKSEIALITEFFFSFLLIAILLLTGCNQAKNQNDAKFTNYFRQGEQLYTAHCSNCHQQNGTGLGRLYPPVNKSDYMDQNFEQVVCLIRYGIDGELLVNGENYNLKMPGIPTLTDLEVAQITTYIYNSWSNNRGIADVRDISKILDQCEPLP